MASKITTEEKMKAAEGRAVEAEDRAIAAEGKLEAAELNVVEAEARAEAAEKRADIAEEKAEKARVAKNKAKAEDDAKDFGTTGKFFSVRLSLFHPYQNIRFMPEVPTTCKMDSWLKSQIEAGLIRKC